jgi:hypothetical protein
VTSVHELNRGSLIFSAIFHLAVVALIFVGLPQLFKPKPLEDMPIAVQLVTLAPETRATEVTKTPPKPEAKPEPQVAEATPEPPKPEPPKAEPPKPAPPPPPEPKPLPPEPPKPEPPKPVPPPPPPPLPEPKPEPKPPEPKPEPKPEPPKPEPPKVEPKPEPPKPKVVEAPKPKAKPEPPKPDQKQLASEFDALLKNLTRQKTAPTPENVQPKAKQAPAQQQASSQPIAPLGAQLTVSELDLIRQQISQCWNIDPGSKDMQRQRPEFRVYMNEDGTIRSATLLNADQMSDPIFRSAAESAQRALRNPRCQPLKLPPQKYDQWQTFTITFDPKDFT